MSLSRLSPLHPHLDVHLFYRRGRSVLCATEVEAFETESCRRQRRWCVWVAVLVAVIWLPKSISTAHAIFSTE